MMQNELFLMDYFLFVLQLKLLISEALFKSSDTQNQKLAIFKTSEKNVSGLRPNNYFLIQFYQNAIVWQKISVCCSFDKVE